MSNKLGFEGKLCYDATGPLTAGSSAWGDASWTEITAARDVTLDGDADEADVTSRGSGGHKQTRTALRDSPVSFDLVWDGVVATEPGKAVHALREAWWNGTEVAMAIMDGGAAVSGSQGVFGNFSVLNCSRAEPMADAMIISVTVKPSEFTDWKVV